MSYTVLMPGVIEPRAVSAHACAAGAVSTTRMKTTIALPGTIHAKAVSAQALASGRPAQTYETVTIKLGGNRYELGKICIYQRRCCDAVESISGGALTITRAVSGTGTIDTDLSEETAVSGDTYELKLLGIDTVEYKGEKARKVSI